MTGPANGSSLYTLLHQTTYWPDEPVKPTGAVRNIGEIAHIADSAHKMRGVNKWRHKAHCLPHDIATDYVKMLLTRTWLARFVLHIVQDND